MANILIERETPIDRGWAFTAVLEAPGAAPVRRTLRLSWADYDLWSSGAAAPERVAQAVLRFLLQRMEPESIRDELDAATVRRRLPEIDAELPSLIEPPAAMEL